jgi:hypothetical protein
MIGVVYISDIPKIVIGIAIALPLLRGWFWLIERYPGMPASVEVFVILGIAPVSLVAGHYIWKLVQALWGWIERP